MKLTQLSKLPKSRRRFPFGLYRVNGHSMHPTYSPGDTLLGLRWIRPKPGQVVVLHRDKPLIKRIIRITPEGIWIEGDNPDYSTDSRQFGYVPSSSVEAVIVLKL